MYRILLLALQSKALSLESQKTLLSEIAEVIPCICRLEPELFAACYDQEGTSKPFDKARYSRDDDFFASYAARLRPKVSDCKVTPLLQILLI